MDNIIATLLSKFGVPHWLSRIFTMGMNKKLLSAIIGIIKNLSDNPKNVDSAVENIFSDEHLRAQFQMQLLKLEETYHKQIIEDLQNARDRDMELRRTRGHNIRANIMFGIALSGIVVLLAILIYFRSSLTSEMVGIISMILTIFGVCLTNIYGFEFGANGHTSRNFLEPNRLDKDRRNNNKLF